MVKSDIYTIAIPSIGIQSLETNENFRTQKSLLRKAVAKCRVSYLVRMLAKANQHAQPVVNLCKMLAFQSGHANSLALAYMELETTCLKTMFISMTRNDISLMLR